MGSGIGRRSALLSGAAALMAPHVARAAARMVRFGHNNAIGSHYDRGAHAFADAVAAEPRLAGVMAVTVYGAAALGDELGMLQDITRSTLDMMMCSGSILSAVVPEVGLLNVPFLFSDVTQARSALDGATGLEFAALAKAKGAAVLAWGENGLRHVTANRPVSAPADLKGLKIRVPQSEMILGGFKALGADAATLPFNQLREALRTGQFSAQENPVGNVVVYKLHELQSHLSLTGHVYDPGAVLASADLLDDLDETQQAALTACAAKGAAITREVAAASARDGIAQLRAAGMHIEENIDRAAFVAASRPFLASLSSQFGEERIRRLMALSA